MKARLGALWTVPTLAGLLAGCGLSPPDIKEAWDGPRGTEQIEFEIKKRVYCDLKSAIYSLDRDPVYTQNRKTGKLTPKLSLPDDWGAQVSLLLQVDEVTGFNPGVALTDPIRNAITPFSNGNVTTPQSFSLGLGATLSSTATRIDRFDPYYTVAFLRRQQTSESVCLPGNDPYEQKHETPASSSPLIISELGLTQWLKDSMFANTFLPSDHPERSTNKDAPDTVSIDLKFIVVTSGSINPIWKLLRITANNGSLPLLAAGRTRTHDLLITLGPPSEKTRNDHLSSEIGQALSSVVTSAQLPR